MFRNNKNLERLVSRKNIEEKSFVNMVRSNRKISRNARGEHLLYLYLKFNFKFSRDVNKTILYTLLNLYNNIKNKKSFSKSPVLLAVEYKKYDILEILLTKINVFEKNSKNVYLIDEIVKIDDNFFDNFNFEKYFKQNIKDKNPFYTDLFLIFFNNDYYYKKLSNKKYFKEFLTDLSKSKTNNLKKLKKMYSLFEGEKYPLLIDDNGLIDILGTANDSLKNLILTNKDTFIKTMTARKEEFGMFNFHILDNFVFVRDRENIQEYIIKFKRYLLKEYLLAQNRKNDNKKEVFVDILASIKEKINSRKDCDISRDKKETIIFLLTYEIMYITYSPS
mgnify:CR=1 FL=1